MSVSEDEFKIHATHLLVEAAKKLTEFEEVEKLYYKDALVPLDAALYIVDELWNHLLEREGKEK